MFSIRALLQTLRGKKFAPADQFGDAGFALVGSNPASYGDMELEPATEPSHTAPDGGKQVFGAGRRSSPAAAPADITVQKTRAGRPYLIVGTPGEVRALLNQPPPKNTAIIFSGNLVMLADQAHDATVIEQDATFHRQTDRIVKPLGSIASRKRGTQFTLKVWLHEDAIAMKRALPRHRFSFALDQYLAYGRAQQSAKLHLITGHSADEETIFHIFTFDKGALTQITEKVLVGTNHFRFAADYAGLIASYDRNGHALVIADPLPPAPDRFANSDIRYLGNEIYNKPVSYFIVDGGSTPSFLVRNGLAFALGSLGFLTYALSMAIPYNAYYESTLEFRRISGTIPEKDLAFGSDQLKTMQERRLFMDEARPQDNTISFLRQIATTLASGGGNVIIKKLSLNSVKTQATDPDIAIVIDTKKNSSPNVSLLDQAKPILDRLSERIGIDFHLAHNGYQERAGQDNAKVLSFTIEGDLKRNQQ